MRERIAILIGTVWLVVLFALLPHLHSVQAETAPVADGAELFATKGCAHCHGPAGVGGTLGPDLQLVRKRLNAGAIARQIHDGGMAMPAFGDQLSDLEIQHLVAYLRVKRKPVEAPARLAAPGSTDLP